MAITTRRTNRAAAVDAACSVPLLPGRALPLVHKLGDALKSEGVLFCQWKGQRSRERWARGEGDIDLLVRRNQMMRGYLYLGGRRLRLKDMRVPTLNVIAEKDDVVPVAATEPVGRLLGSTEFEELRVPAGHALVTGRHGHGRTIPGLIDWFQRHPPEQS